MTKKMSSGILKGRPFGGTGFLFSKNLSLSIRPRTQYNHERVTVMELSTDKGVILLINAYMPFYNTRNLPEQVALYKDTIAYIDSIIRSNHDCKFMLFMDMNCDIYKSGHVFSGIMNDFIKANDLLSAYDFIPGFTPSSNFTRCDIATNSYTLIDGIFFSSSLSDIVKSASISHYGNNLSDHVPVEIVIDVVVELFNEQKLAPSEFIPWSSLTDDDVNSFRERMENELDSIIVPFDSVLHGSHSCNSADHVFVLEKYYNDIVDAIRVSDALLPRRKHGIAKHFWSDHLNNLKNRSIDAFSLWGHAGRPTSGPLFIEKNAAHLQYKRALRSAKREQSSDISDELSYDLLSRDSVKFWKDWNKLESRNCDVTRIDGYIKHSDIANSFSNTFGGVYRDYDVSAESDLRAKFDGLFSCYHSDHKDDDLNPYFVSWSEFLSCISKIETGKATGSFVKAEHIFNGSPKLAVHLHLLFNGLIQHEYVPYDFLCSIVTPIVKDTSGDLSDSANYRPIALSSLFSQLFEHVILLKIGHFLYTDELQFGFKPKHSTTHALFVLNETVDYFTRHGSNVFVTFLDCTKAFDKISHSGLFLKMVKRGIPLCFLNILIYWLSNLSSRCRWRSSLSDSYSVTSGVKQGGILSPSLFTLYIDDLLVILRSKGIGCHINSVFYGSIMFADDLALLAPTRSAMQLMMTICESYCKEFCLTFNTKKTKSMLFGANFDSLDPMSLTLNNEAVHYVSEWKYLGCLVKTGKEFAFSCKNDLSSFRSSANSILTAVSKPSDRVLMMLLHSFSVPILTYASEVKRFSSTEMYDCHVAINDAIRRIFSYDRWESIRTLRRQYGYHDIYTIFAIRRRNFFDKIPLLKSSTLDSLIEVITLESTSAL